MGLFFFFRENYILLYEAKNRLFKGGLYYGIRINDDIITYCRIYRMCVVSVMCAGDSRRTRSYLEGKKICSYEKKYDNFKERTI